MPRSTYDVETGFWQELLGWDRAGSSYREFERLVRPDGQALRILLQRLDDEDGPARAHLDVACSSRDREVVRHASLGARAGRRAGGLDRDGRPGRAAPTASPTGRRDEPSRTAARHRACPGRGATSPAPRPFEGRGPGLHASRGVPVAAPADVVWRWVRQLQVAPYSYDLVDNLGRRSPRTLTPGVGEFEEGGRFSIFTVRAVDPGRSVELEITRAGAVRVFGRVLMAYQVVESPGARAALRPLRAGGLARARPVRPDVGRPGDDAQAAADLEVTRRAPGIRRGLTLHRRRSGARGCLRRCAADVGWPG